MLEERILSQENLYCMFSIYMKFQNQQKTNAWLLSFLEIQNRVFLSGRGSGQTVGGREVTE